MKSIHKNRTSVLGLVLSLIALSAITLTSIKAGEKASENETRIPATWSFTGTNPLDSSHYTLGQPLPCNDVPEQICSIEADASGSYPDLTPQRKADIQEVLDALDNNEVPSTNNTVTGFRSE
ncbi:hypothetical protein [Sphingobacterium mizutaii]|uniref:hypothetical protein n=1 Tax=Sphingobacterium mizutaii TaxID=1010 RepID=UPI0016267E00|nr:hypothetical protein [Sphingobacterium mizutaii]MBV2227597.1 hypothetical protein [Sphingobacterium mizutaii]